jgi:hypothetical protein
MSLWSAIEERLEKKFGRPQKAIAEFLKQIDESKEYWDMVERE